MIEFRKCAVVDGKPYLSLDEAKKAKLVAVFDSIEKKPWTPIEISTHILDQADAVMDALTLNERSRPAARKINGAVRKPRKPKTNAGLPSYQETRREDGVTP